jgi:hypothetical protein
MENEYLWEEGDTYEQKMDKLISALGLRVPGSFMGKTPEQWKKLYSEDVHLNNVPLKQWDIKAQSLMANHPKNPCRLGWNLSLSEAVGAFKHAVIRQIIKA